MNNVTYGPADELMQWSVDYGGSYWTENRSYNARGQLTRHSVPGVLDMEYVYSPTQNNGNLTQAWDHRSNQQVNYWYHSLLRLASAQTTNTSQWGVSFVYDGFGNRWQSNITQGIAPSLSLSFDGNNRINSSGFSYDVNGNMTAEQSLSFGYDVENRLTNYSNAEYYAYAPGNQRIWKRKPNGSEEVASYAPDGHRMGVYQPSVTGGVLAVTTMDTNLTFGRRLVGSRNNPVLTDRLRSVRVTPSQNSEYFPFGEEQSASPQDREKFGSYHRDGTTGLDYTRHRYYASQMGVFVTPHGFMGSARLGMPGGWNRYSYTVGDPVNRFDPNGNADVEACGFESDDACFGDGGSGPDWYIPSVFTNPLVNSITVSNGVYIPDEGIPVFSTQSQPAFQSQGLLALSTIGDNTAAAQLTNPDFWTVTAVMSLTAGYGVAGALPAATGGLSAISTSASTLMPEETPVLGGLGFTSTYASTPGYTILSVPSSVYTWETVNVPWLYSMAATGQSFLVGPGGDVTADEGLLLKNRLLYEQIGDFIVPRVH